MSDEKKDVELLKLTKELLTKQVVESENAIQYAKQQIERLAIQAQQQQGVLDYAKHLLAKFDIPSEPKKQLEVK